MKKINLAVAGLGRIGKIHVQNLLQMENVEILMVIDPMKEC
ncbi:MAG: hypothetical protein VW080_09260 [Flavobacteriaceae bacterium]